MIASAVLLVMLGGQPALDVPPREREVLLELFAATRGASWKDKAGWATAAPVCDWFGVQCDFIDGDATRPTVVGLALSFNDLDGPLPNSIGELAHLQFFAAPGNRLRGDFPERLLERWDQHRFELNIAGSQFDNLVARAVVTYTASGVLCSETDDLRYRLEIDAAANRAVFQSVRCANPKTRRAYCLVREGTSLDLARFSRALNRSGFWTLAPDYSFPFTFTTHGLYLTTEAETGGGAKHSVQTYARQGPLSAWEAQQLFLGLGADVSWTVERRQPRCDFE